MRTVYYDCSMSKAFADLWLVNEVRVLENLNPYIIALRNKALSLISIDTSTYRLRACKVTFGNVEFVTKRYTQSSPFRKKERKWSSDLKFLIQRSDNFVWTEDLSNRSNDENVWRHIFEDASIAIINALLVYDPKLQKWVDKRLVDAVGRIINAVVNIKGQ